jgi:hypothetical protein
MRVFFDASAFVKRYVDEPGSDKVLELCDQADQLVLSIICLPEIIATINRLVRENMLSVEDYEQIKRHVLKDLEDVEICNLTPEVIDRTISCLENNTLRAMDALHLGCALTMSPDMFVSSDKQQVGAARREKLNVIELSPPLSL